MVLLHPRCERISQAIRHFDIKNPEIHLRVEERHCLFNRGDHQGVAVQGLFHQHGHRVGDEWIVLNDEHAFFHVHANATLSGVTSFMAMPISTRISENSFNAANQSTSGTVDIGFPDAPASVRLQLRRSTAELHAALDGCIAPLLSKGVREYVTFLRRTAAALLPIEDALEAADVAALVPDWNERSRRQALALDLAELDAGAARAMPFAPIRSDAFGFGVLYVLEGSRLGATSLAGIVAGHSDARLQAATRYLNHGAGRKLWPRFLTQLERNKPVRHAPQETAAGAIAAFGAFVAAFKAART